MKVHSKTKTAAVFTEKGINKSWCFCSMDKAAVKMIRKEDVAKQ